MHRKVQIRHQGPQVRVGFDQPVVHVARMTGGVAKPCKPWDLGQPVEQVAEAPFPTVRTFTAPCIDVLPQKRDLSHTAFNETPRLFEYLPERAGNLRAARIGHHAERTELVAAFLHREECRYAAGTDARLLQRRQVLELVLYRIVGIDDAISLSRAAQCFGKPVIGLRPDHDIDNGSATQDFLAFRLRDTAGHADHEFLPLGIASLLHVPQATESGIDLLGCLFADVAGVEEDQVRVLHLLRRHVAFTRQRIAHAHRIVDIHLAAIGLDEDLAHVGNHLAFDRRDGDCGISAHERSLPQEGLQ